MVKEACGQRETGRRRARGKRKLRLLAGWLETRSRCHGTSTASLYSVSVLFGQARRRGDHHRTPAMVEDVER
jgi:hypothetical protein